MDAYPQTVSTKIFTLAGEPILLVTLASLRPLGITFLTF